MPDLLRSLVHATPEEMAAAREQVAFDACIQRITLATGFTPDVVRARFIAFVRTHPQAWWQLERDFIATERQ